jgi:translocation and assembly module TamB
MATLIAALPWVLALPFAQRQLAAVANRILAPGRVEFRSITLSWNHSTAISGFVLRDAQGDAILVSPRAVFNWSLSQILFGQPTNGRLQLEKGDLDIERFADGRVDLYETLKPVISDHPKKRIVIRIPDGTLRLRDPAFAEPVVAERADIKIDLGMLNEPINWDIHLTHVKRPGQSGSLDLKGQYSRSEIDAHGEHDVELSLKAAQWPWTLTSRVIEASGELSGEVFGSRRLGKLSSSGDAVVSELVAVGSVLASDTLHIENARARWKLDGDGKAWTVEQLDVTSHLGDLRAQGSVPPTPERGAWLEGNLDLAALARQLPQTFHLRDDLRLERGSAQLRADLQSDAMGEVNVCNISGKVTDLIAHQGQKTLKLPDPATVIAKIRKTSVKTTLEQLEVQTPFLTAQGQGDFEQGIAITAALDLAAFRDRFRDWVDLGDVVLSGKGTLNARYQKDGERFQAKASAELRELRLDGLPMAGRVDRERVSLVASASGRATEAGWPSDWRNLSLEARSDLAECKILAARNEATGSVALNARARADLSFNERHDLFEGELSAICEKAIWSAERISLALSRSPGVMAHETPARRCGGPAAGVTTRPATF